MAMPPETSRPRVALLIETSNRYGRDLLHGVHDWLRTAGKWSIRLTEQARGAPPPAWLRDWRGDGVIARVDTAPIAAALRRTGAAVVDVSAERTTSEFRRVSIDNRAVARLAAAHFREKRLRHFAYCGDQRHLWSKQRGEAFARTLRSAGLPCAEFSPRRAAGRTWDLELEAIAGWLGRLPKPVGVFACYDTRAQQVIEACHHAGLNVPDEVAVLGVDDDEMICELCDPPLSSILPNARRTGYEAAAILSGLMSGRIKSAVRSREIAPVRVVERRSTAALAIGDRHVEAALRHIREHACDGINMKDILQAVPVSRTLLELKFRQLVGDTPHRLIKRHQLERVRQLLVESSLAVAQIADLTGFESPAYLSATFRRETGESPRQFRLRHRT
jgi:LacI family transcriptional regulator